MGNGMAENVFPVPGVENIPGVYQNRMKTAQKNTSVITVTVKYLSVLRDKTGIRQEEVSLSEKSVLGDVADFVHRKYKVPDPLIMFVLNGRGWNQHPDRLATTLKNGDTILIFPPVSGG